MKFNFLVVCLLPLFCFCNNLEAADNKHKRVIDSEYRELIENQARIMDTDIVFYGIVKDQHEKPLGDVRVVFEMFYFSLTDDYFQGLREVVVVTDKEGEFLLENLTGSCLSVHDIEKEGFAYIKDIKPTFDYGGLYGKQKFIPDPQNPIVFILHKKPEPGFVIEKKKSFMGKASGETLQADVYEGFLRSSRTKKGAWGDMRIEIRPAAQAGEHTIKITLNNHDDWLLAKDSGDDPVKDYVAPEDGYSKSVEYTIKQRSEVSKDIYFKGQNVIGTVYSRLHLKLRAGNASVRVEGGLYTNLDGSKNLNYDRKYTLNRKIQEVSAKIDKEPKNVMLYKERAELKERLFLYEDAIADITKAIKIAPENKGLQRLKEDLQWGKERMAERKAQGHKFPD